MFIDMSLVVFLFCKQKTSYDVRISDWSSDVCSSDLVGASRMIEKRGSSRRTCRCVIQAAMGPVAHGKVAEQVVGSHRETPESRFGPLAQNETRQPAAQAGWA